MKSVMSNKEIMKVLLLGTILQLFLGIILQVKIGASKVVLISGLMLAAGMSYFRYRRGAFMLRAKFCIYYSDSGNCVLLRRTTSE